MMRELNNTASFFTFQVIDHEVFEVPADAPPLQCDLKRMPEGWYFCVDAGVVTTEGNQRPYRKGMERDVNQVVVGVFPDAEVAGRELMAFILECVAPEGREPTKPEDFYEARRKLSLAEFNCQQLIIQMI
jgi:hypothetical protein